MVLNTNVTGNSAEIHTMNLLVIQTAFIGDVVLTTPLAQAAKERLGARVTVVVRPSTADLLRDHPAVDAVVVFDKNGAERGVGGLLALGRRLRAERFDAALIPHRSLRSALLAWLARVPMRVGFQTSAGRWLLTHRVPYRAVHEVERNLDLLQPWGSDTTGFAPGLYPNEQDDASVVAFLKNAGIEPDQALIGLAPGSVWATKRWLPERFTEVADHLATETGACVILFGAREDLSLCTEIARQARKTVVTAGKLSLLQSATLARRCDFLISNDTGMAHIAAAMGTPVVGLFGPTVPAFGFAPYGTDHQIVERPLACRPCGRHGGVRCPLGTHACMREITVEQVLDAANHLAGTHRNASPPAPNPSPSHRMNR